MKFRKLFNTIVLAGFACSISHAAEILESDLIDIIKQLQEQVTQQQEEIQSLRSMVESNRDEIQREVRSTTAQRDLNSVHGLSSDRKLIADEDDFDRIPGSHAAIKEVAGVKLGKLIDGLTIKGDARFRYEAQEKTAAGSSKEQSRDRYRVRLRIGGTWHNVEDNWEVGVGIATGDANKAGSSTSTNQSFSKTGVFQTNDINLDYVYARHSWDLESGDLDLILGQQKNPWEETTTFMMWDGDVRPVGVTADYDAGCFFLTGGVYDVLGAESSSAGNENAEVFMVGGQAGYRIKGDDGGLIVAIGYQDYNDQAYEAVNSEIEVDGAALALTNRAEFSIGELFAKFDTKTESAAFRLHGHWARNFAADNLGGSQGGRGLRAEDEDTAWLIGGKVKCGKVELGIDYAHIEADSVFGPIKDSDFGDTAGVSVTNIEGLKLSVKYMLAETISLNGTFLDVEEIEKGTLSSEGEGELYQLDLVYKF